MTDDLDRRLWCAVLGAALHDAATGKDADYIGSRDFHVVADLAGLDSETLAERFNPDDYREAMKRMQIRKA